ncbi:MAG: hydroxyacylglutathione hydrolase [Verrucomicrobiota bacterium]|jgi:glyoxylase-like metal-dependent hydrolase (beta-lactamase superfamily II)
MIPLEDNFADVIGKAQRGLEISDSELAEKARIDASAIRKLRGGHFDELAVFRIAPVLGLGARALRDLAQNEYRPSVTGIDGLAVFNTPFQDVRVNAYLVWDPDLREAVAFDSGADCKPMVDRIAKEKLMVKLILLTHAHADHIADLARLVKATGAPVFISGRESAPGAKSIGEGEEFQVGRLKIKSLLTWGHSRGGMTYFVTGLKHPLAIVGDSIFAGSMGGGNVSYKDAVKNNLEKILTLPEDTIICPGHGPITTVGEEKEHNPFFAGQ